MKNIYHLSTCDTCRRILGELNPGPEVTLQDIKENPLNEAQLEALKERAGSYEALFSKRARLFRQRGLHEKSLTEADYRDPYVAELIDATYRACGQKKTILLTDRLRLGILSSLAVSKKLTFTELKRLLDATDGNLSVHARKLEDAGYLSCAKTFVGRTPRTEYRITDEGKRALQRYLDHMEALIAATRG